MQSVKWRLIARLPCLAKWQKRSPGVICAKLKLVSSLATSRNSKTQMHEVMYLRKTCTINLRMACWISYSRQELRIWYVFSPNQPLWICIQSSLEQLCDPLKITISEIWGNRVAFLANRWGCDLLSCVWSSWQGPATEKSLGRPRSWEWIPGINRRKQTHAPVLKNIMALAIWCTTIHPVVSKYSLSTKSNNLPNSTEHIVVDCKNLHRCSRVWRSLNSGKHVSSLKRTILGRKCRAPQTPKSGLVEWLQKA